MTMKRNQPLPDTLSELRKVAVWYRQASYTALSVCLGHRTGVYQNLTLQEFKEAVETEDGLVINHVGGKTRRTYKTVQVPVSAELYDLLMWYCSKLQPCLGRNEEATKLLLPHLNPFDQDSMNLRIPELKHLEYQKLLRGNRTRRYHDQLTHELDERNMLENTNARELASFRCHSESVASRTYDARNKAARASRASRELLEAANRLYGLEDSETTFDETDLPNEFVSKALCRRLRQRKRRRTSTAKASNSRGWPRRAIHRRHWRRPIDCPRGGHARAGWRRRLTID